MSTIGASEAKTVSVPDESLSKDKEEKEEENGPESGRPLANGSDMPGSGSSSMIPYAGEMERRGEEKLLDERIRERYRREIGDIFDP